MFGVGLGSGGGIHVYPKAEALRRGSEKMNWYTWFSPKPSCIHLARGIVILLKRNPQTEGYFHSHRIPGQNPRQLCVPYRSFHSLDGSFSRERLRHVQRCLWVFYTSGGAPAKLLRSPPEPREAGQPQELIITQSCRIYSYLIVLPPEVHITDGFPYNRSGLMSEMNMQNGKESWRTRFPPGQSNKRTLWC